ncbi:MAG TPA: hypothetical protein VK427_02000, partial [Kofleriaceae bacterium]|nr:hypothetical protein [Kofleriaceae bacterium]
MTFVAAPPESGAALQVVPEEPGFLGQVRHRLVEELEGSCRAVPTPEQAAPDATARHMLVDVSDLNEVSRWLHAYLDTDKTRKLRVQFVGHGEPGVLALGANWVGRDQRRQPPYYMIDSNPYALGVLARYVGRIEEVVFAGCYAGQAVARGTAISGRTLLFTFAEMWRCKVRGASTTVNAADFTNARGGWYTGRAGHPTVGWGSHRGTRDDGRPPRADRKVGTAPRVRPHALDRPRAITTSDGALSDEQQRILVDYFDAVVDDVERPQLANPEAVMTLRYGDHDEEARLICGGQFLSVGPRECRRVFAASRPEMSN